jgi:tetratricopeptide (TPR) repeat protein
MKKILAVIVLFGSFYAQAQGPSSDAIRFDQGVANCENKWFAAKGKDGTVTLGYVYIDPSAGFTFEHYGQLDSTAGGLRAIKSELYDKARVIHRIEQNFAASCLTEVQVAALGLPLSPASIKAYKDNRSAGEHHASWASHYNHICASGLALEHVLKAIALGYSSPGLTFEHAYALNALGRFDETVSLLAPAMASGAKTGDLIAELAYARLMRGEYQQAIELYARAIDHNTEKPSTRRWEFASNIAAAYEKLGNTSQRDAWTERSVRYRKGRE